MKIENDLVRRPMVAIVNGLVNPIPPVKGGGPQIVIYNTIQHIEDAPFEWRVLSLWDKQVQDVEYDRERIIQVRPNEMAKKSVAFLQKMPYRFVKGIFGVVRPDHLLLNLAMVRSLKNLDPDLIIVHDSYSLTYLCHLFFPRKKIIFYHHSCKMHIDLSERRWNRLIRSADGGMIAISQQAFDYTDRTFKKQPTRKSVILNGVNVDQLNTYNQQEIVSLQQKFRIGENDFVFLYAGRIHPDKGLSLLVDTFSKIHKDLNGSIKLLIVGSAQTDEDGSPEYEKSLKKKAAAQTGDAIQFTGYVPNSRLAGIYEISDWGVLPTQMWEGNSLFLMECLAMGLPVIATRKGGIPEVIREGEDGYLIDESRLELELFDRMLTSINERDLWRSRRSDIARVAKERFSYQRVADELSQVIGAAFTHN